MERTPEGVVGELMLCDVRGIHGSYVLVSELPDDRTVRHRRLIGR